MIDRASEVSDVKRLLRYLSDERNKSEIYRRGAIALGFPMLLIMTTLVAIFAMDRRTPEQGLHVTLSIAACVWLQVAIVLAVRYSGKMWPSVLILVTSSVYLSAIFTSMGSGNWLVPLLWLCTGGTIIGGTIQILQRDIKGQDPGRAARRA